AVRAMFTRPCSVSLSLATLAGACGQIAGGEGATASSASSTTGGTSEVTGTSAASSGETGETGETGELQGCVRSEPIARGPTELRWGLACPFSGVIFVNALPLARTDDG